MSRKFTYSPIYLDIQAAVRKHAPKPIVHVGDEVMTTWGGAWKRPHRVRITEIHAGVYAKNCDESKREGVTFAGAVELSYIGRRVDYGPKERQMYAGFGCVLTEFYALDGREWARHEGSYDDGSTHAVTIEEEPCD